LFYGALINCKKKLIYGATIRLTRVTVINSSCNKCYYSDYSCLNLLTLDLALLFVQFKGINALERFRLVVFVY
jgi:hypothetical protein